MHVRQAPLNAVVVEGQLPVIDPQQVQRGGVQVVRVCRIFCGLEPEGVAGAVAGAAPHSAAGKP